MNKWAVLAASILFCNAAGLIGSIFTMPAIPTWYAALQKPWFTPPNFLFGPVWTALFALMGLSLFWVWERRTDKNFRPAIAIFGAQFFLNIIWNFLFFGLQNPLYGLVGILALWAAIAATIAAFYRISKKAGYVLIPYITWVSIAAALNYYVMVLN